MIVPKVMNLRSTLDHFKAIDPVETNISLMVRPVSITHITINMKVTDLTFVLANASFR